MQFLLSTMVVLFLGVVGLVAQGGDAKKDQGKKDEDKIQGIWEVVEFVGNGTSVPDDIRSKIRIVIKDDKMEATRAGGLDKREYVFKLDATKKNKEIDAIAKFEPYKELNIPGIYDFDGDSLKLCMPNGPTLKRPTEFKAPAGSNLGYMVLKRAKP